MQRLGFLKLVLGLASASRPQTLEALSRTFSNQITRRVALPPDRTEAFQEYVRRQKIRRYKPEAVSVEIQDLFLADDSMPSHTGAVTGDLEQKGYRHSVYVDMPSWAVKLRLLRAQNYTLTDRGRVLLLSDQNPGEQVNELPGNPLILNLAERYVFLFCLIDADGDLLREMFPPLISAGKFNRTEAGEAIGTALRKMRKQLEAGSGGKLQQARARLDRTLGAIDQQKGDGMGPRESIATPRTEPFVDCGILEKPNPEIYEYKFTQWGAAFLRSFVESESVADFLESQLTAAMCLNGEQRDCLETPNPTVSLDAYERLRTGLGYVSLRELALASIAQALRDSSGPVYEIRAVEAAIRGAAASGLARLALGREPGTAQVRLEIRAMKKP
jgi:hypothetical protein